MPLAKRLRGTLLKNGPARWVLKSARNLFFPTPYRQDLGRTAAIEVSSACNARCVFCPYRFGYRAKRLMELEHFVRIARSLVNVGYRNLDFTSMAGELFTHPQAVEILRASKEAGFVHVGTFTNGILIGRFDVTGLLTSGIDALLISFPGFGPTYYRDIFGVDAWDEFRESILQLLVAHRSLSSRVFIVFEPRTSLTEQEIKSSEFYVKSLSPFLSDRVVVTEPLRVFDTWGGEITRHDVLPGMMLDGKPLKSLSPLKSTHLCNRMAMLSVLANGDVRLCGCRYDRTIETDADSLFIDNFHRHASLEALLESNRARIERVRLDFVRGRLPSLCRSCSFYLPIDAGEREISSMLPSLVTLPSRRREDEATAIGLGR